MLNVFQASPSFESNMFMNKFQWDTLPLMVGKGDVKGVVQVAGVDDKALDSRFCAVTHDVIDHGLTADWQQRLRQSFGHWTQSFAQARRG
jgi:hypothetical protein